MREDCKNCGSSFCFDFDCDGCPMFEPRQSVSKPRVLNKRIDKIPPDAVYVGRPSKWGNPFIIGRDGTREEVIERYRRLMNSILASKTGKLLQQDLEELRGKNLVCWCAPLPCHADVLLELANKEDE